MADLQITRMLLNDGTPKITSGGVAQFWGAQSTDRENLLIGVVAQTADFAEGAYVRLFPTARCVIRIGAGATATALTGETIDPSPDGVLRYVHAGQRISVIAP